MLFLRSPSEAPTDAAPSVEEVAALERQLADAEARQRDAEEALAAVEAENRVLEAEATAARQAAELAAREGGTENADLPTGQVEVYIREIEVLGPADELPMPAPEPDYRGFPWPSCFPSAVSPCSTPTARRPASSPR